MVTALAAHSGTPVVNVKGPSGHSIVIFVAPEETPESPLRSEEPISLIIPQSCPRPIQPHLPTPVKVNNLLLFLSGYDNLIVEYFATGFTMGFPLHYKGPQFSCHSKNLLSAMQNPTAVDAKLSKELGAHRLASPFSSPPFSVFRLSPLGLVPKKVEGEFRLIHHLSFPKGSSLNDGISPDHTSVSYATLEDAIRRIKTVGLSCFLAKTDIKNAFRTTPIHPEDHNLLGICWRGLYYYDRCMPMGCSSSCKTFETFSTAIEWIAKNKLHITDILHLLDDFLIISPTEDLCRKQLHLFLILCSYLGIPMGPKKTVGPSQITSFDGIELDSISMEARLPQEKLDKCQVLISAFFRCRKVSLQEIQSLTGLLNFACSVVVPGRAFLRRLIDLTIRVKRPHFLIRLSGEVKADLLVWQNFLSGFNGRSFFLSDDWYDSHRLQLYTDASGTLGFSAIFGRNWCYGEWPDSWRNRNIAYLEFYLIVLSLHLWGHEMQNRRVLFFTDNEALVHVINKPSCRDKDLMFFVRELVLLCLRHNVHFKAKHIPGLHNKLADSLSRLQLHTFRQLAPAHMHPLPTDTATQLAAIASFLLHSSLQPSSIPKYQRAWKLFHQLYNSVFQHPFLALPISPSVMALIIAYLYNSSYAPSTVNTYISALGYCHKLMGLSNPSKVFYVSQMLKGYGKVGFPLDSRLPITLPILDRLVAAASLAFYAFLRIGTITSVSKQGAPSPLQLYQLTKLLNTAGELTAFKLTFLNFKHSYNEHPFSVVVSRHPHSCLVDLLSKYLALRASGQGPILISVEGLTYLN